LKSDFSGEWYLLKLDPGGLNLAQAELAQAGIETFAPMESGFRGRPTHADEGPLPIFPGYLFVRTRPNYDLKTLKFISGVMTIVLHEAGRPLSIPTDLISVLLGAGSPESHRMYAKELAELKQLAFEYRVSHLVRMINNNADPVASPKRNTAVLEP